MLQELTFVDGVLLLTVFDLPAVRGKFSCKNIPKFTARPELGRTSPFMVANIIIYAVRAASGLEGLRILVQAYFATQACSFSELFRHNFAEKGPTPGPTDLKLVQKEESRNSRQSVIKICSQTQIFKPPSRYPGS